MVEANDFGVRSHCFIVFFSNGSSRKFFTSFDTYFVLLEQLASPSNNWSTLKQFPCFLFKESELIQDLPVRAISQYTLAISMLSLLFAISFKFFWTSKKVIINSFCCFLFLNYRKKSRTVASKVFNAIASLRFFRNE